MSENGNGGNGGKKASFASEMLRAGCTLVVGLVLGWIAFSRSFVTKDEMDRAIQYQTPYTADKEWLTRQVAQGAKSAEKVEVAVSDLKDSVNALKVEMTRLSTRLEVLNNHDPQKKNNP